MPTTSTSKSSATATPTPSYDPTPSHRARRPRSFTRSLPAMMRPSPPALCCASSTTQRPGFFRRSSATPTVSTSQPNSSSDPRLWRSSTESTSTSPGSPPNPTGQPSEPTCSPSRPKQENTRSATCRQPPPDETSALQATWPPSLTGASQSSRLPTQVRCPGSQAFHQRSMPIPSGGLTWRGDPNSSLTSPIRSMTTPATATPNQSGHHPEATRAPPSSAKSQCGGPPTESIPKTHDQPEEPHSKHFRPCGNNVSTGRSPIPPIRHAARGPTSDRQDAPPLAVSARTKDRNGVRAGRPRPADSTRAAVVQSRRSGHMRLHSTRRRQAQDRRNTQEEHAAHCRIWLFQIKRPAQAPAGGACPPYGPGRAAYLEAQVLTLPVSAGLGSTPELLPNTATGVTPPPVPATCGTTAYIDDTRPGAPSRFVSGCGQDGRLFERAPAGRRSQAATRARRRGRAAPRTGAPSRPRSRGWPPRRRAAGLPRPRRADAATAVSAGSYAPPAQRR